VKYWQRRRQERLYRQWTKHAELPPEAVPTPDMPTDMKAWVEEEGWFYRFRVGIVNLVKKVLRVD
jgi:hypothetical protein